MTLEKVIALLGANYTKALGIKYEKKPQLPLSWALYQTWKLVDKKKNKEIRTKEG